MVELPGVCMTLPDFMLRSFLFRFLPPPLNKYFFNELYAVFLACKSLQKIHKTMVDVGAHLGESALPFLKLNWNVYAFEPDPINLLTLRKKTSSFNKCIISNNAVLNKNQKGLSFYRSEESSGISCLYPFMDSFFEISKVNAVTLKSYLSAQKIKNIGVLKIDAEGCDLFVLQGFPWNACHPEIILAEYEDSKTLAVGYTTKDLARFLQEKDYYLFISEWEPVRRYGGNHKWKSVEVFSSKKQHNKCWGNLIAFSKRSFSSIVWRKRGFFIKEIK